MWCGHAHNTHTHTHLCCVHIHMLVCAGGGKDQRSVSGVSLQELFTPFFETGSPVGLELSSQAGLWPFNPRILPLSASPTWGPKAQGSMPHLLIWVLLIELWPSGVTELPPSRVPPIHLFSVLKDTTPRGCAPVIYHLLTGGQQDCPWVLQNERGCSERCVQKQLFPTHLGVHPNDTVMVRELSVVLRETAELFFRSGCVIVSFH